MLHINLRQSYFLSAAFIAASLVACESSNPSTLSEQSATTGPGKTGGTTGGPGPNPTQSQDPNDPPNIGGLTYYKDIKAIAEVKCNGCHAAGGIGPFTLTSYADVKEHLNAAVSDVKSNIMPPWMPADGCNNYEDSLALTADEKAKFLSWAATGAAEGNSADYVPPAGSSTPPFRADITLTMPKPFTPSTSPDQYRCFVIPWTATTTKYVTGFGLFPSNPAITHHGIVDIVSPSQAASVRAKDGADGHPGYDCSQAGASLNWLAAWAPGSLPRTFGPGDTVGTKIVPGTLLVLQMHYHVNGNPASMGSDQSSVKLQLADSVEHEGHFIELLDLAWVAGGMSVPAGQADVAHSYSANIAASYIFAAQSAPKKTMTIYQVAAHMHQRGSQVSLTLKSGGKSQCLLNIPRWNFNWQNGYQLVAPITVGLTDTLDLNCHWDNSAAHQPVVNGQKAIPRNINWGEGSDDEMCIGFLYIAP